MKQLDKQIVADSAMEQATSRHNKYADAISVEEMRVRDGLPAQLRWWERLRVWTVPVLLPVLDSWHWLATRLRRGGNGQ